MQKGLIGTTFVSLFNSLSIVEIGLGLERHSAEASQFAD
jgi:hypothetical protein